MTENEAIEWIKELKGSEEIQEFYYVESFIKSLDVAIQALETIKKLSDRNMTTEVLENYMQFEDECVKKGFTFKSVIEARDKQIAKKAKNSGERIPFEWYCPICEELLCDDGYKDTDIKYCDNCGQKLDWGDEE